MLSITRTRPLVLHAQYNSESDSTGDIQDSDSEKVDSLYLWLTEDAELRSNIIQDEIAYVGMIT